LLLQCAFRGRARARYGAVRDRIIGSHHRPQPDAQSPRASARWAENVAGFDLPEESPCVPRHARPSSPRRPARLPSVARSLPSPGVACLAPDRVVQVTAGWAGGPARADRGVRENPRRRQVQSSASGSRGSGAGVSNSPPARRGCSSATCDGGRVLNRARRGWPAASCAQGRRAPSRLRPASTAGARRSRCEDV